MTEDVEVKSVCMQVRVEEAPGEPDIIYEVDVELSGHAMDVFSDLAEGFGWETSEWIAKEMRSHLNEVIASCEYVFEGNDA